MDKIQEKQVAMHKDFFDRCQHAIDCGFYMEAMLMEYAAIESRLEALLGVAGLPCGKKLADHLRKDIQISHRVACAKRLYTENPELEQSKLNKKHFEKIGQWIAKRNEYIHGLYKNELKYNQRMGDAKEFSENGLEYCRLLYNEVKRLRRYREKNPGVLHGAECKSTSCKLMREEKQNGNQ